MDEMKEQQNSEKLLQERRRELKEMTGLTMDTNIVQDYNVILEYIKEIKELDPSWSSYGKSVFKIKLRLNELRKKDMEGMDNDEGVDIETFEKEIKDSLVLNEDSAQEIKNKLNTMKEIEQKICKENNVSMKLSIFLAKELTRLK